MVDARLEHIADGMANWFCDVNWDTRHCDSRSGNEKVEWHSAAKDMKEMISVAVIIKIRCDQHVQRWIP